MTFPRRPPAITCAPTLELRGLSGVPLIGAGDDIATLVLDALRRSDLALRDSDVVVVTSKAFSRAEGRFFDLSTVQVSPAAEALAARVRKDPKLCELILRESAAISREAPGVVIVRHRLGFIGANAGIDCSNSVPPGASEGSGPWALLLPEDPDRSAEALRQRLITATGAQIGVVVTDSLGRPFRFGTVGVAVGVAGVPALYDRRGEPDLFGRILEETFTAPADEIAAAAGLVSGQADEGRPFVLVRGLTFTSATHTTGELLRPAGQDLYA